jgi:hypothetical protein
MTRTDLSSKALKGLTELAAVGDAAIPRNVLMKGFVGPFLYAIVARCHGRLLAVTALLREGFQDEALVVLRSLISDSMRIQYIERHANVGDALALSLWNGQVRELRKYAEAAKRAGLSDWTRVSEVANALADDITERRMSLGLAKVPAVPAEGKGLARALGQPLDELAYLRSTFSSHTTLMAVLDHHRTEVDGTTTYLVRRSDPEALLDIGHMLMDHYLRALIGSATVLEWTTLGDLISARSRLEAEFAALQADLDSV